MIGRSVLKINPKVRKLVQSVTEVKLTPKVVKALYRLSTAKEPVFLSYSIQDQMKEAGLVEEVSEDMWQLTPLGRQVAELIKQGLTIQMKPIEISDIHKKILRLFKERGSLTTKEARILIPEVQKKHEELVRLAKERGYYRWGPTTGGGYYFYQLQKKGLIKQGNEYRAGANVWKLTELGEQVASG